MKVYEEDGAYAVLSLFPSTLNFRFLWCCLIKKAIVWFWASLSFWIFWLTTYLPLFDVRLRSKLENHPAFPLLGGLRSWPNSLFSVRALKSHVTVSFRCNMHMCTLWRIFCVCLCNFRKLSKGFRNWRYHWIGDTMQLLTLSSSRVWPFDASLLCVWGSVTWRILALWKGVARNAWTSTVLFLYLCLLYVLGFFGSTFVLPDVS